MSVCVGRCYEAGQKNKEEADIRRECLPEGTTVRGVGILNLESPAITVIFPTH